MSYFGRVAHHRDAEATRRIDPDHVEEARPAAEVLDERRIGIPSIGGTEPPEPEVEPPPLPADLPHLAGRGLAQDAHAFELPVLKVHPYEACGVGDRPDQPAVGLPVQEEAVEGDPSARRRPDHPSREEPAHRAPAGVIPGGVGCLVGRRVREAGARHPERCEHPGSHDLGERASGEVRHGSAEGERPQVRIARARAGREPQFRVLREESVEERVRVGRRLIRGVDPGDRDGVRQPGAVGQEVPRGDRGRGIGRAEVTHLGHVGGDRRVEVQHALLHEPHRGGRRDDLGHREPGTDAVRRHRAVCGEIGRPHARRGVYAVEADDLLPRPRGRAPQRPHERAVGD